MGLNAIRATNDGSPEKSDQHGGESVQSESQRTGIVNKKPSSRL